jgi:hypothetical protein
MELTQTGKTRLGDIKFTPLQVLLSGLLLLLATNFANEFYRIFLIFAAIMVIKNIAKPFSVRLLFRMLVLIAFSISYLYVYRQYHTVELSKIVVIFSAPIMYYIGYYFRESGGYQNWKTPILVVVIGLAIHGCLNLFTNYTVLEAGARETVDFWIGSEWIMTGQISLFILLAGCAYYIFAHLKFSRQPILKLFLLALLVCGLLYNIMGATRTVVYSLVINLALCAALTLLRYRQDFGRFVKYLLIVAGVIFACYALYQADIFGIRTWYEATPLYQRLEILDKLEEGESIYTREGQIQAALEQLFVHPFGGYSMRFPVPLEFIHNTWLNIAYVAGVVPMFLFLLYNLILIKDAVALVIRGKEKNAIFVVGMYAAVLVYLALEPVYEAVPTIITLFCFINGYVLKQMEQKML